MTEEMTIAGKLDKILESIDEKKTKKFRMPFKIGLQYLGIIKRNRCIVLFVRNNGQALFKMCKIEDDTVKIGEYYYSASSKDIVRYKRKPLLIIGEWNMKPISMSDNFKQAETQGTLTEAEKLILTKMKLEAIKGKMNINIKAVLIVLAALGGLIYLLNYLNIIHL